MRRKTPGVQSMDELRSEQVVRVEREDPERVIALLEPLVGERRKARLMEVIDRRIASVSMVMEAPHDPHNGAAVVRSCEAFGVQRLAVVERTEPFLAAASVARGAHKWIDVFTYATVRALVGAYSPLEQTLVVTDPAGELAPADLRALKRVAIVLGNEREGVSEELRAACHTSVRVPMRGFVESLNMSVTAAILLFAATEGRPGDLAPADKRRLYARGLYFSYPQADKLLSVT